MPGMTGPDLHRELRLRRQEIPTSSLSTLQPRMKNRPSLMLGTGWAVEWPVSKAIQCRRLWIEALDAALQKFKLRNFPCSHSLGDRNGSRTRRSVPTVEGSFRFARYTHRVRG